MKKLLRLFGMLLLVSGISYAQTTTVTATVTDSDNVLWFGGTVTVQFVPNPSQPNLSVYRINGAPLSAAIIGQGPISLGLGGIFSVTVYDNTQVTPAGSSWQYTICPLSTSKCGIVVLPAAGSSMDISSQVTATIPAPSFPASVGNYGYTDAEAILQLVPGNIYYNVTDSCYRGYNGVIWGCITGQVFPIPIPIIQGGTGATTAAGALVNLGAVSTATTVNGHALSSNVTVSASDLTTGTLPHAQLPTLLSGDIPNNAANTTGNAATATYATSAGTATDPTKLPLTGGTLTGALTGTSASFSGNVVASSETLGSPLLPASGGTGSSTSQGAATNIVNGNAINPASIGQTGTPGPASFSTVAASIAVAPLAVIDGVIDPMVAYGTCAAARGDGISDDTTALQCAIWTAFGNGTYKNSITPGQVHSAYAGGGKVRLLCGHDYLTTDTLFIPSNVDFGGNCLANYYAQAVGGYPVIASARIKYSPLNVNHPAIRSANFIAQTGQLYTACNGPGCSGNLTASGSINSGSAVLNITTSTFSSADVGTTITIAGAGASGATLLTTIASYTSPTQVTLGNTASTTVSSASVTWENLAVGNDIELGVYSWSQFYLHDIAVFSTNPSATLGVLLNAGSSSTVERVAIDDIQSGIMNSNSNNVTMTNVVANGSSGYGIGCFGSTYGSVIAFSEASATTGDAFSLKCQGVTLSGVTPQGAVNAFTLSDSSTGSADLWIYGTHVEGVTGDVFKVGSQSVAGVRVDGISVDLGTPITKLIDTDNGGALAGHISGVDFRNGTYPSSSVLFGSTPNASDLYTYSCMNYGAPLQEARFGGQTIGGYATSPASNQTWSINGATGAGAFGTSLGVNQFIDPSSPPTAGQSGQPWYLISSNKHYGLVGGPLGSGATYLQSQRIDGTATTYPLLLNPNGGDIVVGSTTDCGFSLCIPSLSVGGSQYKPPLAGVTGSIGGSALAAGSCASGTATLSGAAAGMAVIATPATYPGGQFFWDAYVSATNTVTVLVCTDLVAGGTPTASAYNVRIIQ